LDVIHRDIIAVWNFNDPGECLADPEAQALMSKLIEDLADREGVKPNKILAGGISGVGAIAGVAGGLSGPAAPIVVPIAVGVVFAAWVYIVYKKSEGTLRCLMAYIVGLTIVMQNLYWLTEGENRNLSLNDYKAALNAYKNKGVVHREIKSYVQGANAFARIDRDKTLSKITDLITEHRVNRVDMAATRTAN